MSVEILSTAANYEESHLKRLEIGEWPWKSLEVFAIRWAMYHFLLLVCSNNVSILRHYWYITGDLEKFFIFNATVEITGHVYTLSDSYVNVVVNACYIFRRVEEGKVSNSYFNAFQDHWLAIGAIR